MQLSLHNRRHIHQPGGRTDHHTVLVAPRNNSLTFKESDCTHLIHGGVNSSLVGLDVRLGALLGLGELARMPLSPHLGVRLHRHQAHHDMESVPR
jgi:hypothetical protein